MSRPLRLEFSGALYHVTSRGDRREAIYEDDEERERFLEILGRVVLAFNWICHAYCLMGNHYHLLVETPDGNLSKGMRQLNGVFTQASNRRHGRCGHLFQGRYEAILIDADAFLPELARHIVLNPVRAGMRADPGAVTGAMLGQASCPPWLAVGGLLSRLARRRSTAVQLYARLVAEGPSIWTQLNRQVFLGDDAFVERTRAALEGAGEGVNIPHAQRPPAAPPLTDFVGRVVRARAVRTRESSPVSMQ